MHFCESMGTFGAKCSCARGYRLMQDGENCEAEGINFFLINFLPDVFFIPLSNHFFLKLLAEFPCGRNALKSFSSVSTRALLDFGNMSLENSTSLTDINSTTSTPLTSASTTTPYPAGDSAGHRAVKRLPLWALNDAVAPTERQSRPHKRIVGGKVVIPGEIPWQVQHGGRRSGVLSVTSRSSASLYLLFRRP